nr:CAT RNA binding domain-containing protein [Lacticaseibacillus pantheris]
MLRIAQVLNHNAALVNIDDHREAIVKGKGVAFNKRKGDPVAADRIEKKSCTSTLLLLRKI